MDSSQRDFISKNYRKSSIRQMARNLNLPRKEVERCVTEIQSERFTQEEPKATWKRSVLTAAGLFILAFLLRLFYIHGLRATPFFGPLSDKLDDGVYDLMAQTISGGNWIADMPLSAYRIPLYPYFLAALYRFFGHNIALVHTTQSFIGAFTGVFIYFISKEIFKNHWAAVIAGVLSACYIPFIFYENLLLGESLSIFFNLVSLLLLAYVFVRERLKTLYVFLAGIFLGLSILLRPNTLIPVLFLAFFIFYFFAIKTKAFVKGVILSVVFLMAVLAAIIPITIRNYYLHKDFIPLSAVGGVNLFIGNNAEANGKFHLSKGIGTSLDEMIKNSEEIAQKDRGRLLKPSQVSAYWMGRAVNFALNSPTDFLRLLWIKTAFFFNHYEFPDILDIYFTSQFIPFLKWGVLGYGFVVVFAFYGVLLAYEQKNSNAMLLGIFAMGYGLSVILFFVSSRYRLPVVPVLIIFSAVGVHQLIDAIKFQKKHEMVRFAIIGALASIFVFWPVEVTNFATNYNSLAISLKNREEFEKAEKYYRKAIEIAPAYPSPYHNLAILLSETGRQEESAELEKKYGVLKK